MLTNRSEVSRACQIKSKSLFFIDEMMSYIYGLAKSHVNLD